MRTARINSARWPGRCRSHRRRRCGLAPAFGAPHAIAVGNTEAKAQTNTTAVVLV